MIKTALTAAPIAAALAANAVAILSIGAYFVPALIALVVAGATYYRPRSV
ncbi:hypothetical protein FHX37_2503 [Haloactinospora alba]|uniref:Uncharacterized protein n=1 Tax=Haloactinospora alba TaxID=405555 RepID=A0A543NL20_9ACTN|nr:hypothetical protein FHX37_2503 [Haloactinospora alba]